MELTIDRALQQGIAAHKQGRLQDAEQLYKIILQTQPAHPDANHNLGVITASAGKGDEALPFFKKALSADADVEQFWLSYIGCLITEGHYVSAALNITNGSRHVVSKVKIEVLEERLKS